MHYVTEAFTHLELLRLRALIHGQTYMEPALRTALEKMEVLIKEFEQAEYYRRKEEERMKLPPTRGEFCAGCICPECGNLDGDCEDKNCRGCLGKDKVYDCDQFPWETYRKVHPDV